MADKTAAALRALNTLQYKHDLATGNTNRPDAVGVLDDALETLNKQLHEVTDNDGLAHRLETDMLRYEAARAAKAVAHAGGRARRSSITAYTVDLHTISSGSIADHYDQPVPISSQPLLPPDSLDLAFHTSDSGVRRLGSTGSIPNATAAAATPDPTSNMGSPCTGSPGAMSPMAAQSPTAAAGGYFSRRAGAHIDASRDSNLRRHSIGSSSGTFGSSSAPLPSALSGLSSPNGACTTAPAPSPLGPLGRGSMGAPGGPGAACAGVRVSTTLSQGLAVAVGPADALDEFKQQATSPGSCISPGSHHGGGGSFTTRQLRSMSVHSMSALGGGVSMHGSSRHQSVCGLVSGSELPGSCSGAAAARISISSNMGGAPAVQHSMSSRTHQGAQQGGSSSVDAMLQQLKGLFKRRGSRDNSNTASPVRPHRDSSTGSITSMGARDDPSVHGGHAADYLDAMSAKGRNSRKSLQLHHLMHDPHSGGSSSMGRHEGMGAAVGGQALPTD